MYYHPHIEISRKYMKNYTLGVARAGDDLDFYFFTLELPDRDNQRNISCIPEGEYWVFKRKDKPVGVHVYQFENVPGRSYIQIHTGNFTNQIEGCILPGSGQGFINDDNVCDVVNSRDTMNKLAELLPDRFLVRIHSERA